MIQITAATCSTIMKKYFSNSICIHGDNGFTMYMFLAVCIMYRVANEKKPREDITCDVKWDDNNFLNWIRTESQTDWNPIKCINNLPAIWFRNQQRRNWFNFMFQRWPLNSEKVFRISQTKGENHFSKHSPRHWCTAVYSFKFRIKWTLSSRVNQRNMVLTAVLLFCKQKRLADDLYTMGGKSIDACISFLTFWIQQRSVLVV